MRNFIQAFNDIAVRFLSNPYVVGGWWAASIGSIAQTLVHPNEIAVTLALSFLALAYSSAIVERQLRYENDDKRRDEALHKKIDSLLVGVPKADDTLVASEKDG